MLMHFYAVIDMDKYPFLYNPNPTKINIINEITSVETYVKLGSSRQ